MEGQPIPQNFIDWACSQSGCDGGHLKAPIWLCGIEWGAGSYNDGEYYKTELPAEILKGVYVPQHKYIWKDHLYRYGRSFAKLFTAIQGKSLDGYEEFVLSRGDEDIYKMNLYPIAFDSTDHNLWIHNKLHTLTGFDEKYLFQTWCFFNRFPRFAKLARDKKPELIIGTGTGYLKEFIACFGGAESQGYRIHYDEILPQSESNTKSRRYYWLRINGGKTTLVVIPFFSGQYGLNSNYLLEEMGRRIKELMKGNNF